jgi:hypothetical protein
MLKRYLILAVVLSMTGCAVVPYQPVVYRSNIVVDTTQCMQYYNYHEREYCYRGAEARARQIQNQRNSEAYRKGLGY